MWRGPDTLITAERSLAPVAVHRVGAEARLDSSTWMGRAVVLKQRVVKGYRHPILDKSLQAFRIKNEVRLMLEARRAGIAVPVIYSVDLAENRIVMEEVKGMRVKDALEELPKEKAEEVAGKIGEIAGRLHAADIVHGDLTTSNMLLEGNRIVTIDFSLGSKTSDLEDKGVDMHLLEEAFHSAHYRRSELFEVVKDSYVKTYSGGVDVLKKVKEIEKRGRYTRKE
ncbi:MAG: Kae1-associated serine/threonine protein kinase [Candidatus Thermoplasmatota archaeon]|nr:Kae1-associated serine/threonine protein kinase [Candidatus Thermoplasmatota archaeon]